MQSQLTNRTLTILTIVSVVSWYFLFFANIPLSSGHEQTVFGAFIFTISAMGAIGVGWSLYVLDRDSFVTWGGRIQWNTFGRGIKWLLIVMHFCFAPVICVPYLIIEARNRLHGHNQTLRGVVGGYVKQLANTTRGLALLIMAGVLVVLLSFSLSLEGKVLPSNTLAHITTSTQQPNVAGQIQMPPKTVLPMTTPVRSTATSSPPTATPVPPSPTPNPLPTVIPLIHDPCGGVDNPWGYTYCNTGKLIFSPAPDICSYYNCINNFYNGKGYVEICQDGMISKSGGIRGSCSYHGGDKQPLYQK